MKVLITGAQFNNKGAQSLLFTVIDQLKKRSADIEIYYLPIDDYRKYDKSQFNFKIVYGDMEAHYYENRVFQRPFILAKSVLRRILKKNSVKVSDVTELHRLLPKIDAIIDISGYQLTSKFSNVMNRKFLYYIEEAKRYGKKIILMPQSFGPFDYEKDKEKLIRTIKKDLSEVDLIFAREKEGFDLLCDLFDIKNIKLSPDLVLQGDEINWENIYTNVPKLHYPEIGNKNNVAVIPNTEAFKHGNENLILEVYNTVINKLLLYGKTVYIFRHSNDLSACKKIYEMFSDNEKVNFIENDFSCEEYSDFITQFDFIIASRYHAIVHAYKKGIPSLIFGWAVKYQRLAELFNQSKYVFDITANDIDIEKISDKLETLIQNYNDEKNTITQKQNQLYHDTCFDDCWSRLVQKNL